MKVKQRVRYLLATATRLYGLGVDRSSGIKQVVDRTGLSSGEPCGIRLHALGYTGADYWV